jgi:hypothetical protein
METISQNSLKYFDEDYCRSATKQNYTSGLKVLFKSMGKNLGYSDEYLDELRSGKRSFERDINNFTIGLKGRPSTSISRAQRRSFY